MNIKNKELKNILCYICLDKLFIWQILFLQALYKKVSTRLKEKKVSNIIKTMIAPLMLSMPINANTPDENLLKTDVFTQQEGHLKELMAGKPQEEMDKVMNSWEKFNDRKRAVEAQSTIDSLAYRKLFEGTELAKDSSAVEEFNSIAKKTHPNNRWGFPTYSYKMDKILSEQGISEKQINKFKAENNIGRATFEDGSTRFTSRDNCIAIAKQQFQTDSVIFRKFFERHNSFNKEMKEAFKNISKTIKPVM